MIPPTQRYWTEYELVITPLMIFIAYEPGQMQQLFGEIRGDIKEELAGIKQHVKVKWELATIM